MVSPVAGARASTLSPQVEGPVMARNPVRPPYLFMEVVGLEAGSKTWDCLKGHAQPIVAMNCPVPVESNAERQAFRTLRKSLGPCDRSSAP